ncbi:MAG: TolC family protein [Desulfonatronovibrio sp.]
MRLFFRIQLGLLVLVLPFLFSSPVFGQSLYQMLERVVVEHDLVQAAEAGKGAADQAVNQARGEWFPHVSATANLGQEHIDPATSTSSTNETRNTQNLRASQLVYDFGGSSSGVKRARSGLEKSEAAVTAARQDIIRRGITAYLDVYRHFQMLELARNSEQRIVELTGIEEIMVTREAGLASDVLQAKSQLAGARALRVQAEGQLNNALNRFKTVFGFTLAEEQIEDLELPVRPVDYIPITLEEALDIADENSIDLYMASMDIDMARHEVQFRQSRYYPSLHLVGELKRKENDAGISGTRKEALGMVELTWDLFRGGKDMAAVSEARYKLTQLEKQRDDLDHRVQERVLTAWQNMITSRENARYLRDQANIMQEFLELARRERRLGTRSLLDVLNGEITHLNALSNAVSADVDRDLAIFNMLYAMGRLELDLLSRL